MSDRKAVMCGRSHEILLSYSDEDIVSASLSLRCERPRCVKSFLDSNKYRKRAILAERELDNIKKRFTDRGISEHLRVGNQKIEQNSNLSKDGHSNTSICGHDEVCGIPPGKTFASTPTLPPKPTPQKKLPNNEGQQNLNAAKSSPQISAVSANFNAEIAHGNFAIAIDDQKDKNYPDTYNYKDNNEADHCYATLKTDLAHLMVGSSPATVAQTDEQRDQDMDLHNNDKVSEAAKNDDGNHAIDGNVSLKPPPFSSRPPESPPPPPSPPLHPLLWQIYEQFFQYFLSCMDYITQGIYSVNLAIDYFIWTFTPTYTEWAHLDKELIKEDLHKVAATMLAS